MFKVLLFLLFVINILARPHPQESDENEDKYLPMEAGGGGPPEEAFAKFWYDKAAKSLKAKLELKRNTNIAKNVILFLGDGMSIATLTATRVYIGNENYELSFEKFPHTAVSKTYNANLQVTDSASAATAYLSGVKANAATVGVTANVRRGNCQAMSDKNNHVKSIAHWSQLKGKSTGLVTVTRVTHGSPAGVYASTALRYWESDADLKSLGGDPKLCEDIASQLVNGEVGKKLNVIFGGGRQKFLPKTAKDEENLPGSRLEKDLIEEWKRGKPKGSAKYITKKSELLSISKSLDYVLGLFANSHMSYNTDRDSNKEPSLTEMTQAAIRLLSKNDKGFFLFVEGGNIDRAHHSAKAHKALNDAAELANAVQAAIDMTSANDTLIVVTSDHSHTLTISGYPPRKHDILGFSPQKTSDDLPFTTLNYANGPGYKSPSSDRKRYNLSNDPIRNVDYQYPSVAPMGAETHGGDDVLIFANGPWSHLYTGVVEQHVIPHFMAYASCVGDQATACDRKKEEKVELEQDSKGTKEEKNGCLKVVPGLLPTILFIFMI